MSDDSLIEKQLLTSYSDDDGQESHDEVTVTTRSEKNPQQEFIIRCVGPCDKDFDSSAIGCNPVAGLCSLCYDQVKGHSFDSIRNDVGNLGNTSAEINSNSEKEFVGEVEPEEKEDALPEFLASDRNQKEVENYTGFKNAKELGYHFKAAILGGPGQVCSIRVGNLGHLEFVQKVDPNDKVIEGKHGLFKFVRDPYARKQPLIMYGYDIFDAYQFGESAIICLCMIMNEDGTPSGYILFKIGKTRCIRPRVDGFLYHIRTIA